MPEAPLRSESGVLASVISEIDRFLARALRSRGIPGILEESICYTVLDGGKRLRPALVLLCCEAAGGERKTALAPAGALELIHNFSLVHDDLPAMDDDALRRGRPTLHMQAGEAMAILAGDAMLSIAFELIAETPIAAERVVQLNAELAASTTAMINGQVLDTLGGFPPEMNDEQRLLLVHRNKTGALLRAGCRMGALCGMSENVSTESAEWADTLGRLDRYGRAIGLMFQIVDDLLDVTQSPEHIGKATGKDIEAGKLTFPGIFGIEKSRDEVSRLRREAEEAIADLGDRAEPLRRLCDDLAVRTR